MNQVKQAREDLIEDALDEISNIPAYSNFYINTYYVIAKLGLQRKAKVEKLFEDADWNDVKFRDELLERIKHFLIKYIK